MSTKRAKQHKRDVFLDVRARKFWKMFDQEGSGNKCWRQFVGRRCKFRKRAYDHEKKLENGLLTKNYQQSLRGVLKNRGLLDYVER